jgi:hypothetical protein
MPNDPDTTYLVERERAERCMAANAKCPEAAKAHLEMAATYRRLADEARRRAKAEVHLERAETNLEVTGAVH